VHKTHYSAFIQGSSDLDAQLSKRGIENVIVTGTATNVCCESTARDAMMLNYRTIMVSDANAAFSDEAHNATLRTFWGLFGDVQSTGELVQVLRPARPREAAE
jgi:ureidoacrylate peracid hydrolase